MIITLIKKIVTKTKQGILYNKHFLEKSGVYFVSKNDLHVRYFQRLHLITLSGIINNFYTASNFGTKTFM